MGLPGAGKTYLSKILCNKLNAKWINADITRRNSMIGISRRMDEEDNQKE